MKTDDYYSSTMGRVDEQKKEKRPEETFYMIFCQAAGDPLMNFSSKEAAVERAKKLASNNANYRYFILKAEICIEGRPVEVFVDALKEPWG
jgi:hypothetical protein